MTKRNDELFSLKYKRLDRISTTAKVFSWLVLVFFILQAVSQYLNFTSHQSNQSVLEMVKQHPESAIDYFLSIINIMIKGVVYWLTLKGVSLGLSMIVETNLNYRGRMIGESHE